MAIEVLIAELDKDTKINNKLLIMGDINVNNLTINEDARKLEEALLGYNLNRLKLPATRVTHQTQSSIDLVCTNMDNTDITAKVLVSGLSDHYAQICNIIYKGNNTSTLTQKRKMNKTTMENLRLTLEVKDWSHILNTTEADRAFELFHLTLQQALDITCPISTFKAKSKNNKKVWNAEGIELKNNYLEALNRAIITDNPEDKRKASQEKRAYDLKLKTLRRENYAKSITEASNRSQAIWNIINQERKSLSSGPQFHSLTIDQQTVTSPSDIANNLNSYFTTIAEKTLIKNKKVEQQLTVACNQTIPKLHFHKANCDEVSKIIKGLKPKSSAGVDDFSPKIIKHCQNEILVPLTCLINKSLSQGVFPNCLKIAKVYPKYKQGNTSEPGSYRPISLISTFSKIIERVVLKRLLSHLEHNNLLTTRQHGFMRGRSTITALVQLIENIIDKLEEGSIATTIFLDFSKAFDCLGHDIIIQKLKTLGIDNNEADWFKSYLSNRKQLVEIPYTNKGILNKHKSDLLPVTRGVPQGSVLGPVLYTLLTNDFPQCLEEICKVVMYADDTALTVNDKNKDRLDVTSTTALRLTKQYCNRNDLVLNESKTQQLIFTTTNNQLKGLPELVTANTTKYLGLILDNNLSWKPQVDKLSKKLSSGIYVV